MKDYYEILLVTREATQEKIKQQYRRLIRTWHPDKFPEQGEKAQAEEKTKEINEAYGVLRDAAKRARYDRQQQPRPARPATSAGTQPATPERRHTEHLHYEFLAAFGDHVQVWLDHPANVILLDSLNYSRYRAGLLFNYAGGYVQQSQVVLPVLYSGKWHLVIDLGGSAGSVRATVQIIR